MTIKGTEQSVIISCIINETTNSGVLARVIWQTGTSLRAGVMISVRTLAAATLRAMCQDNITAVAATDYKSVDRFS